MMKPNPDPADEFAEAPVPNDVQVIVLKVPDGFKPSTAVENAKAVPPVKPPRVAFPFEDF